MPKVSVILPTYNRAYILGRAIRSVLNQDYTDFELIIVDDGSRDATADVVASLQDSRIRYLKQVKNRGVAFAINIGIHNAVGDFIAIQASDDEWLPGKLRREVGTMEHAPPSVGVVYSQLEKYMKDGKRIILPAEDIRCAGNIYTELLKCNFITPQVVLVRRECFERIGMFDESLDLISLEDWDMWLRIAEHYEFLCVPHIGARAYILQDSLTSNQKKRLYAREAILKKHKIAFEKHPALYGMQLRNVGHAYALRGETMKARQYLLQSWQTKKTMSVAFSIILLYIFPSTYRFIINIFITGKQLIRHLFS